MLALIDYKYVKTRRLRRLPEPHTETILSLQTLRLTVQFDRVTGNCERSVEQMLRSGADVACFSEYFPASDRFPIRRATTAALYRHIAPLVCAQYTPWGDTALLECDGSVIASEVLRVLTKRYRYVLVRSASSLRDTIAKIRRQTGASVIVNPAPERIRKASFAVLLRPCSVASELTGAVVFAPGVDYLAPQMRYITLPKLTVTGQTPPQFPREVIISEALRRGAISLSDIRCGEIEVRVNQ